jgi:hypothetical protein
VAVAGVGDQIAGGRGGPALPVPSPPYRRDVRLDALVIFVTILGPLQHLSDPRPGQAINASMSIVAAVRSGATPKAMRRAIIPSMRPGVEEMEKQIINLLREIAELRYDIARRDREAAFAAAPSPSIMMH